jgi:hypothetical protein
MPLDNQPGDAAAAGAAPGERYRAKTQATPCLITQDGQVITTQDGIPIAAETQSAAPHSVQE